MACLLKVKTGFLVNLAEDGPEVPLGNKQSQTFPSTCGAEGGLNGRRALSNGSQGKKEAAQEMPTVAACTLMTSRNTLSACFTLLS